MRSPDDWGSEQSIGRHVELLHALNAAATSLQRSARSEEEVFRAVREQIAKLDLQGGLSLLDESREWLIVRAAAHPGGMVTRMEKLVENQAEGFKYRVADVDACRQVIETNRTLYQPDGSNMIAQMLPDSIRQFAKTILKAFGSVPTILAPLVCEGQVQGIFHVGGKGLTTNDLPAMEALANHVAIALENARLYARYHTLFHASPQVVALIGMNGLVIDCNEATVELSGLPRDELVGRPFTELGVLPAEELGTYAELFSRMINGAALGTYEVEISQGEAESRWLEVFPALLEKDNAPYAIQIIAHDVTARKQAADELGRLKEFNEGIVRNLAVGIFASNVEGYLTFVNPAAGGLLGYSLDELVGSHWSAIVPQDQQPIVHAANERRRLGVTDHYEVEMVRKDGRRITVLVSGSPRFDPLTENFVGTLAVFTNVTDRKQAEAEREELLVVLEKRSAQMQTAAEVSKSASTILDLNTLLDRSVSLIKDHFGLYYIGLFLIDESGEYAVLQAGTGKAGRKMLEEGHRLDVGGPSMVGWCTAHNKARIATDVEAERVHFRNPILPETRSEIALPLISRDRCIGALSVQSTEETAFSTEAVAVLQTMADQLAIAIDNTRLYEQIQRYAAELEERVAERTAELAAVNKELEAFSYSVSHDLQAPVRRTEAFVNALLEDYADKLDNTCRDYLQRIRAASIQMRDLIQVLMDLAHVTRSEIRIEPVNLSGMAQAIAADLQQRDQQRRVDWVIMPALLANADARLLRVVLENLLTNAWKFTRKQAKARIEFGCIEEAGDRMTCYVRDNGAGFDMTYAGKLFGAFQRLHTTAEFEGTGIGLATVQRIIHRHGGRVWAESALNQGATFFFTLPGRQEPGAQERKAL